jgi:hypothetical protein
MKVNATDFRIEEIKTAQVNGVKRKIFKAFRKQKDAFVFCGQFSAPVRTANKDLWKVAMESI